MDESAGNAFGEMGEELTKEFLAKAMDFYAWFDQLSESERREYTDWIARLAEVSAQLPISFAQLVELHIQLVPDGSKFLRMSPKQVLAAVRARPDLKTLPTGFEVI